MERWLVSLLQQTDLMQWEDVSVLQELKRFLALEITLKRSLLIVLKANYLVKLESLAHLSVGLSLCKARNSLRLLDLDNMYSRI